MILEWQVGRGVGWLKRLALAAEDVAASQRELLAIERQRTPPRREIRHAEFGTADFTETERQWRRDQGDDI